MSGAALSFVLKWSDVNVEHSFVYINKKHIRALSLIYKLGTGKNGDCSHQNSQVQFQV